jgi:tRNA pseudouridine13 synthase
MLPLATSLLPGTLGAVSPKHQYCEEVLTKQPSAGGTFIWLRVSKEGLSTQQARAAVSRAAAVPVEAIGFAGRRDRIGRCIQWFSVEAEKVDNPGALRRAGTQGKMKVLDITSSHAAISELSVSRLRHQVRIRGGNANGGYHKARAILDALRRSGLPNYVPLQRFGTDTVFARWGRMLCQGRPLPAQVRSSGIEPGRCLRAWQEMLFDRWLSARVLAGDLGQCRAGEVLMDRNGALSLATDLAHAQRRMDSWDVVALGPLYGEGMQPCEGQALESEQRILSESQMEPRMVARLRGGRRAARVQPSQVLVDLSGEDLTLSCELPVDTHLQCLLDEVIKTPDPADQAAPAIDEAEPPLPSDLSGLAEES